MKEIKKYFDNFLKDLKDLGAIDETMQAKVGPEHAEAL